MCRQDNKDENSCCQNQITNNAKPRTECESA